MNESTQSALPTLGIVTRWIARLLGGMILLFCGFFIVAHIFGDEGNASRPLKVTDFIGLGALIASLVGLAIAYRWELTGSAITITAVSIGAIVNWRVLTFPLVLIPIVAMMFLFHWWSCQRQATKSLESPDNKRVNRRGESGEN